MRRFSVKNFKITNKTKNLFFSSTIKPKYPLTITPILNPSFQDTMSLVYIFKSIFIFLCKYLDSEFSSNSIPLVCASAASSILKCSLCDSLGYTFLVLFLPLRSFLSNSSYFLFPGFFLDLSFQEFKLLIFLLALLFPIHTSNNSKPC